MIKRLILIPFWIIISPSFAYEKITCIEHENGGCIKKLYELTTSPGYFVIKDCIEGTGQETDAGNHCKKERTTTSDGVSYIKACLNGNDIYYGCKKILHEEKNGSYEINTCLNGTDVIRNCQKIRYDYGGPDWNNKNDYNIETCIDDGNLRYSLSSLGSPCKKSIVEYSNGTHKFYDK